VDISVDGSDCVDDAYEIVDNNVVVNSAVENNLFKSFPHFKIGWIVAKEF
ncbi:MAG: hypothetical protein HY307_00520, partial [Arcobacter sp.]|nr:hypothetical protein [Arcobacter sp.]